MGNTNTQKIKAGKRSQDFNNYVDHLCLESRIQNKTHSCLKPEFMLQLSSLDKYAKNFSRQCNPVCPLSMKITKNWVTCCFISPLMALANPIYIISSQGNFLGQCEILAVSQGQVHHLNVIDAKVIVPNHLCLIFLQKPFSKVGWLGLSYLRQECLSQNKFKSFVIGHPERVSKKSHKQLFHHQEVRVVKEMRAIKKQKHFISQNETHLNPVILAVTDHGPELVGIQISTHECLIFDRKIFDKIRRIAKKYIENNIMSLQNFIDNQLMPIYINYPN